MDFKEMYRHDKFANDAGVVLKELNAEHAVMCLEVEKRHMNAGNVAHGGVLSLMADISMAAIANFHQSPSVSIQSDIRFLAAGLQGDTLTAEATPVFGRKSMYNCRATITNQRGEMIAIAEGMFHTKRQFKVDEA